MVDMAPILFTIPIHFRERMRIEPETILEYEEFVSGIGKRVKINFKPKQPFLFGNNNQDVYQVSAKGQIAIPKHVLVYLGIQNKDEIDIELYANDLTLIRGHFFRFKEIIESKRNDFFMNNSLDLLIVRFHQESDEEHESTLWVDNSTFLELRHLYFKIKSKFDPESSNPWVGVPEDLDGSLKGISIHYSTKPEAVIIQKFIFEFLPKLVAHLCRERIPFTIHESKIAYETENLQRVEEIPVSSRNIAALFQRHGYEVGDYLSDNGYTVTTVKLHTNDLVVIEQRGSVVVRFWPCDRLSKIFS
ncbi:AbrB/MazE/SpoVT family DNA-binding domain-containing protein [Paenibacillus elgii]|uniref:AbrB/MazE/SpoVT family DNA-binding domain-containing protein n=1 Tax=Paenibacillus elgii TaxID=189691 RepID=UPI000248CCB7|nr:AbrB/MazE/SpoVT family DNA-binding domain-containing protein [Paenibacillus elgii]